MSKQHRVPAKADAGTQVLGVSIQEAIPLGIIGFAGIIFYQHIGLMGFLMCLGVGYALSKALISFNTKNPNGYARAILYKYGLLSYSPALQRSKEIFVGDQAVSNPANSARVREIVKKINIHYQNQE